VIFVLKYVFRVVFEGGILGGVRNFWGNPYLSSTTVLFDLKAIYEDGRNRIVNWIRKQPDEFYMLTECKHYKVFCVHLQPSGYPVVDILKNCNVSMWFSVKKGDHGKHTQESDHGKHTGGSNCGIYCLSYCVSLACKTDPYLYVYRQNEMRKHLTSCLENGILFQGLLVGKEFWRMTSSTRTEIKLFIYMSVQSG